MSFTMCTSLVPLRQVERPQAARDLTLLAGLAKQQRPCRLPGLDAAGLIALLDDDRPSIRLALGCLLRAGCGRKENQTQEGPDVT